MNASTSKNKGTRYKYGDGGSKGKEGKARFNNSKNNPQLNTKNNKAGSGSGSGQGFGNADGSEKGKGAGYGKGYRNHYGFGDDDENRAAGGRRGNKRMKTVSYSHKSSAFFISGGKGDGRHYKELGFMEFEEKEVGKMRYIRDLLHGKGGGSNRALEDPLLKELCNRLDEISKNLKGKLDKTLVMVRNEIIYKEIYDNEWENDIRERIKIY